MTGEGVRIGYKSKIHPCFCLSSPKKERDFYSLIYVFEHQPLLSGVTWKSSQSVTACQSIFWHLCYTTKPYINSVEAAQFNARYLISDKAKVVRCFKSMSLVHTMGDLYMCDSVIDAEENMEFWRGCMLSSTPLLSRRYLVTLQTAVNQLTKWMNKKDNVTQW